MEITQEGTIPDTKTHSFSYLFVRIMYRMAIIMKKKFSSIIVAVFIVFFAIVAVSSIGVKKDIVQKEQTLAELTKELDELEAEGAKLNYYLNDADEAELFEHLAREKGYCYSNEKIFYDITPGN